MNELKKVLLAGIGLSAMTLEKADAFIKDLVEKGRLTVEEEKSYNKSSSGKERKKLRTCWPILKTRASPSNMLLKKTLNASKTS